jgi:hypothetical protein
MAYTDKIPPDALSSLANQISRRLAKSPETRDWLTAEAATPALTIGEYFEVWILRADAIKRAARQKFDLEKLAKRTGLFHHQIRFVGQGQLFARSIHPPDEPDKLRLRELFFSPLAKDIDVAIDWLDLNVDDSWLARLLIAPSYQLTAFWLLKQVTKESRILIISLPETFKSLQKEKLIDSREFLESLAKEQNIIGVSKSLSTTTDLMEKDRRTRKTRK